MKKLIFIVTALIICLPVLNAQPRPPRNGGERPEMGNVRPGMRGEHHGRKASVDMKRMKETLSLTDEQAEKLNEICSSSRMKQESERQKFMDKSRKIAEKRDAKIQKLLTEEQLRKYNEMKTEMSNDQPKEGLHKNGPAGPRGEKGPGHHGQGEPDPDIRAHQFCNQ